MAVYAILPPPTTEDVIQETFRRSCEDFIGVPVHAQTIQLMRNRIQTTLEQFIAEDQLPRGCEVRKIDFDDVVGTIEVEVGVPTPPSGARHPSNVQIGDWRRYAVRASFSW